MKWLIKVIFKAVKILISVVLSPIDLLISNVFPDLAIAISKVNSFFTWVTDFIRFVLSWLPFDSSFYTFLVAALVFYYSVPFITHTIKLVVKWYNALKP